jgi:hypothetical protein
MLTAYWDVGLQIKDLPADDSRVPLFPFENLSFAESVLAKPNSLGQKVWPDSVSGSEMGAPRQAI